MISKTLDSAIQSERFRLYASLSRHFNSYFEISRTLKNYLSEEREDLIFTSPFVDFNKRSGQEKCSVGVWSVSEARYNSLKDQVAYIENFGRRPAKIYVPMDFKESYKMLFDFLGEPEEELEGILVSSGRSIWVFADDGPFCLKYDTRHLTDMKYFTEAQLGEAGIWHSKSVTRMLREEDHMFYEDGGLSVVFSEKFSDKEPLTLTYLIRRLNPSFEFSAGDNLIPLHSFLSQRFWSQPKLLSSLGIKKPFADCASDLAKVVAGYIAHAITQTAVHFESHQQNINLVIGGGAVKKIIVQDLQDIFFDPVSYFGIMSPKTAAQFSDVRDTLFNFQWMLHFNAQGEMIKNEFLFRESMSVSSFYRRYFSNQGHVNESVAALSETPDFLHGGFESEVLKHLQSAIPLGPDQNAVLQNDLYRYIDRCVFEQHRAIAAEYLRMAEVTGAAQVSAEHLLYLIQTFYIVGSAGFPVHESRIDKRLFGKIYDLFDSTFFLAHYDGKPVMIMVFKYVSI